MSVREGVRACLNARATQRASLIGTVIVGLSLLAMWPRGTLETALRTGQASDTYGVVSICLLLVLLYLGARFGAEDFSTDPAAGLREYITLTPISLVSLAAQRLAVGLFHTIVLLLLAAPILIASMAVGGAGAAQVAAALAVAGAAGLAARMWGLLALVASADRRPLKDMIVFTTVTASAALTFFLAPAVSPFRQLEGLTRAPLGGSWAVCAAASAGAAVVLAAASAGAMAVTRARARRRVRGT